jgi:hypothetical protein
METKVIALPAFVILRAHVVEGVVAGLPRTLELDWAVGYVAVGELFSAGPMTNARIGRCAPTAAFVTVMLSHQTDIEANEGNDQHDRSQDLSHARHLPDATL